MRTWSLSGCVDRLVDAADDAVSIVKYLGAFTLTPVLKWVYPIEMRDPGWDGAEQLAQAEAEFEVHEPGVGILNNFLPDDEPAVCFCGDTDDHLHTAAPGTHTESDRLCIYNSDGGWPDKVCGVCRPVRDIVEQMLHERDASAVAVPAPDSSSTVDGVVGKQWDGNPTGPQPDLTPLTPNMSDIGPVNDLILRSGGQMKQYGPRPRISTTSPRPAWSDLADALTTHKPSAYADAASPSADDGNPPQPPAEGQPTVAGLVELPVITQLNNFIEKWVDPESVAHLLDNDDNDGERLRRAIFMAITGINLNAYK